MRHSLWVVRSEVTDFWVLHPHFLYFSRPLPSTKLKPKQRLESQESSVERHHSHREKIHLWTSLVAQWLRIHLPVQGTRVRALVREDPTCCGATKPVRHNYWACALEPTSHNYWACMPQLLKPACLEPVLHNKRSHHNEKPLHYNEE